MRRTVSATFALVLAVTPAVAPVARAQYASPAASARASAPAASTLPDLGDSAQVALSPAQERKIGETALKQLRAAGGYLNDPEVNDYLNELGQRLVAARNDARADFHFFAVPDPSINAFAMPGGLIGVNTALILLTQTES